MFRQERGRRGPNAISADGAHVIYLIAFNPSTNGGSFVDGVSSVFRINLIELCDCRLG